MTKLPVRATLAVVLLALATAPAAAQAPPPPPAPVPAAAPALQRPTTAPPPSTVAPAAAPQPGAPVRAQAPAAVRAPAAASTPVDSVRPAVATAPVAPPAGAVAQCVDGTYVVAPRGSNDCAAHRGLLVVLPGRTERQAPPVPQPVAAAAAARPAAVTSATPPLGATARCKDGTYITGSPAAGRCDANGGMAAVLPETRPAAPPPPQARRP